MAEAPKPPKYAKDEGKIRKAIEWLKDAGGLLGGAFIDSLFRPFK
jgi:hypothetical protein